LTRRDPGVQHVGEAEVPRVFGLWKKWKRRRLAGEPFPEAWLPILERRVPFFREIEGPMRERFLTFVKIFAREKDFVGAGGFEIDDEVRVVVSAAAVRLVLHLGLSRYDRLREILVYRQAFRRPGEEDWVLGESHTWGTVVLAWTSVVQGLANQEDGHDTATHEFAHVLDRAGGDFDGTPELRAGDHYRPWALVMTENFLALRRGTRRARRVLRHYGATNEAEFFAVATEAFFEKPDQMREHTPDLYAELARFYHWDPAARAE
jgi:Mlc titration factor MtfA (ptsG expression regulator)